MKITLRLHDGREASAQQPYEGSSYVLVPGLHCECSPAEPLQVAGIKGKTRTTDYGASSPAACSRCQGSVGSLDVEFETLFGAEEDECVLKGRYRVY